MAKLQIKYSKLAAQVRFFSQNDEIIEICMK